MTSPRATPLSGGGRATSGAGARADLHLAHAHAVRFYESHDFLAGEVASLVAGGLRLGEACVTMRASSSSMRAR